MPLPEEMGYHGGVPKKETVPSEQSAPKIINEFVGEILGNQLDRYDLPQYNLKLYMIGPGSKNGTPGSEATPEQNTEETGGEESRKDQAEKGTLTTSGRGYLNNSVDDLPENTVVLAQTGVTEVGIDDLEIVTVPGGSGTAASTVNFTITQPNAADFPDQIVRARTFLGAPPDAMDCPLFLEITWRGRKESDENIDNWNTEAGGGFVTAAGPYVYQLLLKNFSMNIDESGSTYDFETVVKDDSYTADAFFRTRTMIDITGSTIYEMLSDLETQINNYNEKEDLPERISFGLENKTTESKNGEQKASKNVPGLDIQDQSLDIQDTEVLSKVIDVAVTEAEDVDAAREESEGPIKSKEGTSINKNPETNAISVTLKEGISMDRVLGIILSMNKEFMSKTIRTELEPTAERSVEDVDATKQIMWYNFSGSVEYLGYDEKHKHYQKKAHIIPRTFLTDRTDIAVFSEEVDKNNNLTVTETGQRVNQMKIKKAYEYIFTGRNDQILSCDLSYNNGIALLLPPDRGMLGDVSLNASHIMNPAPVNKNEDLETKGVDKLLKASQDKKGNFFDQLKELKDDLKKGEQFLNDLGNAANFTQSEIKNLIQDTAGTAAQKLQEVLSTQATAQAVADNLTAKKSASSQANVVTQSEEFSPSTSGFVYGGDLIGNTKYAEQLTASGQKIKETRTSKDETSKEENPTGVAQRKEYLHKQGFANVGTTKGIKNNLFTYLYDQHQAQDFLMKLNMQLRGDPWWLGKPVHKTGDKQIPGQSAETVKETSEDGDNYLTTSVDNFFLFSLNSPRLFDPDVENEDNNTGLWIKEGDGTSYFISGIYQVKKVVHSLNNGEYKIDVEGIKETAISLTNIDRQKDKFSYVDGFRNTRSAQKQDGVNTESDDSTPVNRDHKAVEGALAAGVNKGKTVEDLLKEGRITQAEYDAYISKQNEKGNT